MRGGSFWPPFLLQTESYKPVMKIYLNGEIRDVSESLSLTQLLDGLGIVKKGIAVELNQKVLNVELWPKTDLKTGDILEIVHFVGGGAF